MIWQELYDYENYMREEVFHSDTEEVLEKILDRFDAAEKADSQPFSDTLY